MEGAKVPQKATEFELIATSMSEVSEALMNNFSRLDKMLDRIKGSEPKDFDNPEKMAQPDGLIEKMNISINKLQELTNRMASKLTEIEEYI